MWVVIRVRPRANGAHDRRETRTGTALPPDPSQPSVTLVGGQWSALAGSPGKSFSPARIGTSSQFSPGTSGHS